MSLLSKLVSYCQGLASTAHELIQDTRARGCLGGDLHPALAALALYMVH